MIPAWNILPPVRVPEGKRRAHLRDCSDFAADLLDRFPGWGEDPDRATPPDAATLATAVREHGLDPGLRRFRNREMLRIVWRDLCGLATLGETFADLTRLAELCLQQAIDEQQRRLEEKHGVPRGQDGSPQRLFVMGLGKFGGVELNLSSDIDILFCYPQSGQCDGRRGLANEQFFTRQARAVIASLAEVTEDGFCFRVDTRLRPFGDSGPLTSSVAALEQYYQREGRDWERYALIKARPVAGDLAAGRQLVEQLRPFVYRRYIDYSSVEALQEMHANVRDDALRRDRLDDIKRGPGGIREIEFLVQCFQILRGGREATLQTPSLEVALREIGQLELLPAAAIDEIRRDYAFLRFLENRVQALRDQQTHCLPPGEDCERIARAMGESDSKGLLQLLATTRQRVDERFQGIFPSRREPEPGHQWVETWRRLRAGQQQGDDEAAVDDGGPLALFLRRLGRIALSQRAHQRLDRFMPELLDRLDRLDLHADAVNRVFDLVLAICRRSAYLVLLVQHPKALERMLELFERSAWIADQVIRFPALLDELIDPALGQHIPGRAQLGQSVARILEAAPGAENVLENLNYLKLATTLRIAVGQLHGGLPGEQARAALSDLAEALLGGVLETAAVEIRSRHGGFEEGAASIAAIGYGSLGARELGYVSDLDIVFLFEASASASNGERPLPPERYFARLAQRVLSFLTVMTPSGRLYEVDTRLRPNGRAGALVSSMVAYREYQLNEAWTWELQALTRARWVAGDARLARHFETVRREVLCRTRNPTELAAELLDMRRRMQLEHGDGSARDAAAKHQPGGLIDIEFIAQLGILANAAEHPEIVAATATLDQLAQLQAIGWLSTREQDLLSTTMRALRSDRMLQALLPDSSAESFDTAAVAALFRERLGGTPE